MDLEDFPRYKIDEQRRVWKDKSDDISKAETEELLKDILEAKDFWAYTELATEILIELAEVSDDYVGILQKILSDFDASNLVEHVLFEVGKSNPDLSMDLLEKIQAGGEGKLMVLSGALLGGYSTVDEEDAFDIVEDRIDTAETPGLRSYAKAFCILVSESQDFSDRHKKVLQKLRKSEDKRINLEILNFALENYSKDEDYLYGLVEEILDRPLEGCKRYFFNMMSYKDIIEEDKLFQLIQEHKDSDPTTLHYIVQCLKKHPDRYEDFLDLFIYWVNKGLYHDIKWLEWGLEEVSKEKPQVLSKLVERREEVDENYRIVLIPGVFSTLTEHNKESALESIEKFSPDDRVDKILKLKLMRNLLGICYIDLENLSYMQELAKMAIEMAKEQSTVDIRIPSRLLEEGAEEISAEDYNLLIDRLADLIDDLMTRKPEIDYDEVRESLEKYPELKELSEDRIQKYEDEGRYSSLVWLLENEEPELDDLKTKFETPMEKAWTINQIRGRFAPRAYLQEIEEGIENFMSTSNGRLTSSAQKEKALLDGLFNEEGFWTFVSELIVLNKLQGTDGLTKDIVIGSQDLDYYFITPVDLPVIFEHKKPEMSRDLNLSVGAVAMKNRGFHVVKEKYNQAKKSGFDQKDEYKDSRFYVLVDRSHSGMDGLQLEQPFYGSPNLTLVFDKEEKGVTHTYPGRGNDSLADFNPDTKLVGGAIYFKRVVVVDEDMNTDIKLVGDIIHNPHAEKQLDDKEVDRIEKILFS